MTNVPSGILAFTCWRLIGLRYDRAETLTNLLRFQETVRLMDEVGVWQINPATIIAIAATLLTNPPTRDIEETFDQVNSPSWTDHDHAQQA